MGLFFVLKVGETCAWARDERKDPREEEEKLGKKQITDRSLTEAKRAGTRERQQKN